MACVCVCAITFMLALAGNPLPKYHKAISCVPLSQWGDIYLGSASQGQKNAAAPRNAGETWAFRSLRFYLGRCHGIVFLTISPVQLFQK